MLTRFKNRWEGLLSFTNRQAPPANDPGWAAAWAGDRGLEAPPTKPSKAEKRWWPAAPNPGTVELDNWLDGLLDDTSPFPSEVSEMHVACGCMSYDEIAHCLVVLRKREISLKGK
jgi:hypothetical protein